MPKTVTNNCQHDAVVKSRRMFHRVLSTWAIDLVALRSAGLDTPGPRTGSIQNQGNFTISTPSRRAA